MNERFLEDGLCELEQARTWSPRVVSRLESLLRDGSDDELFRINPILFAEKRNVAREEAIDLFLHAAKAGLVDISWSLICPTCGLAVDSFAMLSTVGNECGCNVCHVTVKVDLDTCVLVSFTVSRRVRAIDHHEPTTLDAEDYHFRHRFTQEAQQDGHMRALVRVCAFVEAGERKRFEITAGAGLLSAADLLGCRDFVLSVRDDAAPAPSPISVVLREGVVHLGAEQVRPGRVTLEVENTGSSRASLLLVAIPEAMLEPASASTKELAPFLTGAALLANQTFRRLFRTETLRPTEGIGVRDVTLLFTDLKGSTELYERIGDLEAFALVREHFDRLTSVIQGHGGAVVKTIGDAVMAAFRSPEGAVRAALEMRSAAGDSLTLKIGIHRGASIAVTLNDSLDYFGRTVNIAARVQAEAAADEICVTEEVYASPGVAEALSGRDVKSDRAHLKGIGREATLFRIGRSVARTDLSQHQNDKRAYALHGGVSR